MASNRDKRLRRQVRHSYIISTVSISLVLFLLGIVSYITFTAIDRFLDPALKATISVELNDNLYENEKQAIRDMIQGRKDVESIGFLSEEDKFEDLHMDVDVDMELLGGDNPLHDSFEVTLKREYAEAHHINAFADEMKQIDGVVYVDKPDPRYFEESRSNISAVVLSLVIFSVVLLFISLLLLNNTLRLAIYSKRYLINTMKLVGATKWYIMRPLLRSALTQGLVSGIIAAGLMCGTIFGIASLLPEGIDVISLNSIIVVVATVLVVGILITIGFSAMAINKFVNMKSNKIHLY